MSVPVIVASSGMTLKALPEWIWVIDTTSCFIGSALRLAMVWSAPTRAHAPGIGSTASCG